MSLSALLGDVNILVTTDVHSWLDGHVHLDQSYGQPARTDATFGDVVSLLEHVRAAAAAHGRDVWFFDNGDVIDGTGLSAATPVAGSAVFPLLAAMPYDALNLGNHELYQNATVTRDLLASGFVASRNGTYLTSNVDRAGSDQPVGSRFALLNGTHGSRLLVLGFLYDMKDACGAVDVSTVAEALRAPWFEEAAAALPSVDAVVVLAHMHIADPLVRTILDAIRSIGPAGAKMPVQFLTGHSHIRGSLTLDAHASALEAGKYADTLGFASFNVIRRRLGRSPSVRDGGGASHRSSAARALFTVPGARSAAPGLEDGAIDGTGNETRFVHVQLPMQVASLARFAGVSEAAFGTAAGSALGARVRAARRRLGVTRLLGCSPQSYAVNAGLSSNDSAWGLYLRTVAPEHIFSPPRNRSQWFVSSSGALRYNVHAGNLSVDDVYCVLPFVDRLRVARRVSGAALADALDRLRGPSAQNSARRQSASGVSSSRDLLGTPSGMPWGVAPGVRPPTSLSRWLPSFVSTSDAGAALDPFASYDAIFGDFDAGQVLPAIQATRGGAPVELEEYTSVQSDTHAWFAWGRSLPPTC
jgi:hypothetical protein